MDQIDGHNVRYGVESVEGVVRRIALLVNEMEVRYREGAR